MECVDWTELRPAAEHLRCSQDLIPLHCPPFYGVLSPNSCACRVVVSRLQVRIPRLGGGAAPCCAGGCACASLIDAVGPHYGISERGKERTKSLAERQYVGSSGSKQWRHSVDLALSRSPCGSYATAHDPSVWINLTSVL